MNIKIRTLGDGKVEVTVEGVKGTKCLELTSSLRLGNILSDEPTHEMYEAETTEELANETGDTGF